MTGYGYYEHMERLKLYLRLDGTGSRLILRMELI
jgi:hypothetical protein